jgi:hypothetical protein
VQLVSVGSIVVWRIEIPSDLHAEVSEGGCVCGCGGEENVSGELRTDVLRALDKDGGVRVRSRPRPPLRKRVQELFSPGHGPAVQGGRLLTASGMNSGTG